MAAPKVEIVKDADGGYSLVGEVEGVTLKFATVNPSQIGELAAAQGKSWTPTTDDDDETPEP